MGLILPANKLKFWDAFDIIGKSSYETSWSGNEIKVHSTIHPIIRDYLKEIVDPLYDCVYHSNSKELSLIEPALHRFITELIKTFPDDSAKEKEFWIGDCTSEDCIRYMSAYKTMLGKLASKRLECTLFQEGTACKIEIPKENAWSTDVIRISQNSIGYYFSLSEDAGKVMQHKGIFVVSRNGVNKILTELKQLKQKKEQSITKTVVAEEVQQTKPSVSGPKLIPAGGHKHPWQNLYEKAVWEARDTNKSATPSQINTCFDNNLKDYNQSNPGDTITRDKEGIHWTTNRTKTQKLTKTASVENFRRKVEKDYNKLHP